MTRLTFDTELASLRESLLRMATMVESQIAAALDALRDRDREAADEVRATDQHLNELFRQIREQCLMVIATQQPVAADRSDDRNPVRAAGQAAACGAGHHG
jgi:phosphate transport system protein